jgi:cob(I)alamin adenosyltransferase
MKKGYIQVYTGNDSGKTTASLGLILRAVGAGKKVFLGQFAKGQIYSEIKAIEEYLPSVTVKQYGLECFINNKPKQEDIDMARKGLEEVREVILSGDYDLVVLDEANIAVYYNLFSIEELIDILKQKPEAMEIVITGRYATPEIIEFADLVTEMKEIKHYYTKGIIARLGVEF